MNQLNRTQGCTAYVSCIKMLKSSQYDIAECIECHDQNSFFYEAGGEGFWLPIVFTSHGVRGSQLHVIKWRGVALLEFVRASSIF